jgi:TonB-linked SusC/RagA family outer membrane protein
MNKNYPKYLTKHLLFIVMLVSSLMITTLTFAQNPHIVTGTVTNAEDNSTIPGVSVAIKGTSTGTITDVNGKYSINVPDNNSVIHFSFIGFETQELVVGNKTTIDIQLQPTIENIDEVVITALGIKRQEKSLGYSVENVKSEELSRVAHENVLNSLSGKVSGVVINSTGGPGSSVSMVIRGATSLSTDNQPLFVVDGVPIASTVNNVGGFGSDNRVDYGNAISDIDPESIESITILKGPSAAALYGTRAGNGVVLITTKKAKEGDNMKITVSTNTVFDMPSEFINVQNKFANGYFSYRPENVGGGILPEIKMNEQAGAGPECDKGYWAVQWNSPLDANGVPVPIPIESHPDNIKNFLNNYAVTSTNTVALSSSKGVVNYRANYTNMVYKGLIPNTDLNKNNFSLSASSKLWEKLTISTDINFGLTGADNRPATNRGANPLEWAYKTPTNVDIRDLRNYGSGNNVLKLAEGFENPYFLAYEVNNSFDRYRIYGNITAFWEITKNISLKARYLLNKSDELRETKMAPGYSKEPNNGTYGIATSKGYERNWDFLASYKKDWTNFNLNVSFGGNLLFQSGASISNSAKSGTGLTVPNLYTVQNINSSNLNYYNSRYEKAINSIYGLINFGWKDIIYVDLTARNDWSSTLPAENRSYFYPSASLSFLLSNVLNMGSANMIKLRGGWAQVGNDTGPYRLVPVYGNAGQWGDATRLYKQSGLLSPNLLPEEATSVEYGIDVNTFFNRLRFSGTYYTVDNRNQILGVQLAASTGFSGVQINAGLLESDGWEITLGGTPVKTDDWTWDVNFNFTKNKTIIKELTEGVDFIEFWDNARVKSIGYVKDDTHDGRVGNLYSREIQRVEDEESPYNGYPLLGSGLETKWQSAEEYTKVGNYNPDFILGMQSALSFKNITLNLTFDWRSGGQYVSQTYRYISEAVLSQTLLDRLVNPGDLGGAASDQLKQWVLDNADELLFSNDPKAIGGPTPDYGGFPESFSGYTVYDGFFAPGVVGHYDDDGKFILEHENLGQPGTSFLPYVLAYPWDIGRANLFDADYIKLREISVSYHVPSKIAKKMKMHNLDVSLYSRNIMLWTKASGFGVDPERAFQAESNGRFSQGVERFNVNPWVIPVGFKVQFTF